MTEDDQWESPSHFPADLRDAVANGAETAFQRTDHQLEDSEKGPILAEALHRMNTDTVDEPPSEIERTVAATVEQILAERGSLPHDVIALLNQWVPDEDVGLVERQAERYASVAISSIREFADLDCQVSGLRITDDAITYELMPPESIISGATISGWQWHDIRHLPDPPGIDFETELALADVDGNEVEFYAAIVDSHIIHLGPSPLQQEHGLPPRESLTIEGEIEIRTAFANWISSILADILTTE